MPGEKWEELLGIFFNVIDVDQSGGISVDEYKKIVKKEYHDQLQSWFDAMDSKRDGKISYDELHKAYMYLPSKERLETVIKAVVVLFDGDGDGKFDRQEFTELLDNLEDKSHTQEEIVVLADKYAPVFPIDCHTFIRKYTQQCQGRLK